MKKRMNERLLICVLLLGMFLVNVTVVGAADPTVDEMTLDPVIPAPASTVTFTAKLSGDTITEVYLIVKECKDICYTPGHNESMTEISSGEYQKEITLIHSDATNIEYWLVVNSGETWHSFQNDYEQLYLSTSSNGDTGNGDDGGSNQSPGFELIVLMVSIGIILFVFKRKRKK